MPQKLGWIFVVGFYRRKVGLPILVELSKDIVGHFCRKSFICRRVLDKMENLHIVQIDMIEDERLTYNIVGSIVEIFRSKSCFINLLPTRIAALDYMLLN